MLSFLESLTLSLVFTSGNFFSIEVTLIFSDTGFGRIGIVGFSYMCSSLHLFIYSSRLNAFGLALRGKKEKKKIKLRKLLFIVYVHV